MEGGGIWSLEACHNGVRVPCTQPCVTVYVHTSGPCKSHACVSSEVLEAGVANGAVGSALLAMEQQQQDGKLFCTRHHVRWVLSPARLTLAVTLSAGIPSVCAAAGLLSGGSLACQPSSSIDSAVAALVSNNALRCPQRAAFCDDIASLLAAAGAAASYGLRMRRRQPPRRQYRMALCLCASCRPAAAWHITVFAAEAVGTRHALAPLLGVDLLRHEAQQASESVPDSAEPSEDVSPLAGSSAPNVPHNFTAGISTNRQVGMPQHHAVISAIQHSVTPAGRGHRPSASQTELARQRKLQAIVTFCLRSGSDFIRYQTWFCRPESPFRAANDIKPSVSACCLRRCGLGTCFFSFMRQIAAASMACQRTLSSLCRPNSPFGRLGLSGCVRGQIKQQRDRSGSAPRFGS